APGSCTPAGAAGSRSVRVGLPGLGYPWLWSTVPFLSGQSAARAIPPRTCPWPGRSCLAIASSARVSPLLAEATVDALAEQVGVPVVAGVLLDHVDDQLAQRDRLTLGVVADETEVVVARELLSEGDLLAPRRPRLLNHGRVMGGPVEVGVGVGLGLIALWYLEPGEPAAEPGAFHLSHVPDQP